jgi:hypothetical protein
MELNRPSEFLTYADVNLLGGNVNDLMNMKIASQRLSIHVPANTQQ